MACSLLCHIYIYTTTPENIQYKVQIFLGEKGHTQTNEKDTQKILENKFISASESPPSQSSNTSTMLSPHPPCQAIYQAFIILDRVQNRRMTNTPNQSTSLTIAMNQHRFPNPTLLFHVQKVVYRSKNCGCIIF